MVGFAQERSMSFSLLTDDNAKFVMTHLNFTSCLSYTRSTFYRRRRPHSCSFIVPYLLEDENQSLTRAFTQHTRLIGQMISPLKSQSAPRSPTDRAGESSCIIGSEVGYSLYVCSRSAVGVCVTVFLGWN